MGKNPAYGPLCENLEKLKLELKLANAALAACGVAGKTSEAEKAKVDELKERIWRCEAHMLGLSHGMQVCCSEAERASSE